MNNVLPARHVLVPVLAVLLAGLLTGCGDDSQVESTPAAVATPPTGPPPVKRTVLLDPGHNGGNAAHPEVINRKVPDGRGGTKACNTVGTATADNDVSEHVFNWNVADDVRDLLQANGVNVVLTHDDDDDGVGPCVDARAEMAAKVNADVLVSIHADGAPAADHGFHVIYSKPALNSSQGEPSISLATAVRNGLTDQMLATANYVGKNGLIGRDDLAGLNLAKRPAVLVECGNMKNAKDAINMVSDAGQARIAQGIGNGILKWLAQNPPGSLALAEAKPLKAGSSSTSSTSSVGTTKKHSTSSSSSTRSTARSTTKSSTSRSSGTSDSASGRSSSGSSGTRSTRSNSTASTESDLPG